MKNYLLTLLGLVIISFSACKKDCNNPENKSSDKISIVGAIVIKTGTLNFTNKNATGTATIYLQKNGSYILAFEQMQFSSMVDVDVKFSKANDASISAIKLFSIKNITEHLYYVLPPSIDVNTYNYLFLQSDIVDTPVASTLLK